MPPLPAYQELVARSREISLLQSSSGLISWDQQTYMPKGAAPFRAEQSAYFSGIIHRLSTAPEVNDWIHQCEDHDFAAGTDEETNTRNWRRNYDREAKLPKELVESLARVSSLAHEAWTEARRDSKFSVFRPHLATLLDLTRQTAECWGYEEDPYDALLEGYEPGMRASHLRPIFAGLREHLAGFLPHALEYSTRKPPLPPGNYPIAQQQAFNRLVAERIGFNFNRGRIDTAAHPFCTTLGPGDCRLTTRYDETNFLSSFYGVLHEAGHGLYEQGLRGEHYGTPAGSAVSLGIHESQSRFWENRVGRSREFWDFVFPLACDFFPDLRKLTPQDLWHEANRVSPSFIRVEADEVTYDLHILLRFEIEQKLIRNELSIDDLPDAWNAEFENLIGLKVPDDARGCLQDVHWSGGGFGYFPTYSLGNLNASQLWFSVKESLPSVQGDIRKGEFGTLLGWLRQNIHEPGQRYTPGELIQRATGKPLSSEPHKAYLASKFS